MNYQYAVETINYEDYSSGRVLYNQQGATAFPVRLVSEIFGRCTEVLKTLGKEKDYTLYDPLCGGAYSMTTLGFLHGEQIKKIYASDINPVMVDLANKNLSLLTGQGLNQRIKQIEKMIEEYGKESHREALLSAKRLMERLQELPHEIDRICFTADATSRTEQDIKDIDIVITDLPYGEVVSWENASEETEAVSNLLDKLYNLLSMNSVVAITAKKKTKIQHVKYRRIDRFTVGKREIVLLSPISH